MHRRKTSSRRHCRSRRQAGAAFRGSPASRRAMVPTCNGDLRNLRGAPAFDWNRFSCNTRTRHPASRSRSGEPTATASTPHGRRTTVPTPADYRHPSALTASDLRLAPADQTAVGLSGSTASCATSSATKSPSLPMGTAPRRCRLPRTGAGPATIVSGWRCRPRADEWRSTHKVIAPSMTRTASQPHDGAMSMPHMGDPPDLTDSAAFVGNRDARVASLALTGTDISTNCTWLRHSTVRSCPT